MIIRICPINRVVDQNRMYTDRCFEESIERSRHLPIPGTVGTRYIANNGMIVAPGKHTHTVSDLRIYDGWLIGKLTVMLGLDKRIQNILAMESAYVPSGEIKGKITGEKEIFIIHELKIHSINVVSE